jgi:hypothetical protein
MKLRFIAGVAFLVTLTACDDKTRSDVAPDAPAMEAVAAGAAGASALGVQAYTLGILADVGRKPVVTSTWNLAGGDTLLPGILTCPVVTAEAGGGSFLLRLNYGSGCVSKLDSLTTSGQIEFTAAALSPSGLELTAEFRDFVRDGRAVDGILEASGHTGEAVAISARALGLTGQGAAILLNADLSAQRVGALVMDIPPLEPAYCATWIIPSGSGSVEGVVGSQEIAFGFSVTDTMFVSTCCAYPTAGILRITAGGMIPATVDFGDGTCDNVATLTIAGHSQEITLGD